MLRQRNSAWRRLVLRLACAGVVCCSPPSYLSASPVQSFPSQEKPANKNSAQPPTLRWSEQQPGCTFSRGDDGKYRYGLWSGDVGVVVAVDAREVQIIRHRIEPIFGVLLEIHYRGAGTLNATPEGITLQFMKHFKIVQPALDPDSYSEKIQADADALDDETRREVAKHPEQKQARETRLQDYQKSVNELIEFLSKNALRAAHLNRDSSSQRVGLLRHEKQVAGRLEGAGGLRPTRTAGRKNLRVPFQTTAAERRTPAAEAGVMRDLAYDARRPRRSSSAA